ncbi:beta-defensin 36-like [Grammomys surdaster]|uniref:beta-defensin 36-like n=1 Tax=Grammomys surdaster TaxID=491861 RepID=UPI00109F8AA1|nr:beta-defensin 36-like [Grammomys surdaster]
MKTVVLTMVLLLLLTQVIPGNPERCWKSFGICREECINKESFYIFCWNGKMCCVKPKNMPQWSRNLN